MKLAGEYPIAAPPQRAYELLQDPAILAKCIPGCEGLERAPGNGDPEYSMKMKMGIASISGSFDGKVRIADRNPPSSFRLLVEGTSKIGFMKGDGVIALSPAERRLLSPLRWRCASRRRHRQRRPAPRRNHRQDHHQTLLRQAFGRGRGAKLISVRFTMKLLPLALMTIAAGAASAASWNAESAAAYLDGRMAWWTTWPSAARDHGTFCVSCHTSMPYALARPTLRGALHETSLSANERKFLDNIEKRVAIWNEAEPFYNDAKSGAPKSLESRGTEAVMNALILARYGEPAAKDALRNMWDLQVKTGDKAGSWVWLNFHNEPWEADDSAFWGATLGALAAGAAPAPEYQDNIALFAGYLQREEEKQSTLNRAVALWAGGKLPQLLTPQQRAAIAADIVSKQREDGGWSEASVVTPTWKRRDGTPMDEASDGYATGLMVVALRESGIASAKAPAAKGVAWLAAHQDSGGAWLATSMNKKRDPTSDAGRFMSDAATAYAVLALSDR